MGFEIIDKAEHLSPAFPKKVGAYCGESLWFEPQVRR